MTSAYEQEQKDLQSRVIALRETLSKAKAQRLNIDSFLAQVRKYTEVKELDAEIIQALVERIDVFKTEKVPGTRTKKQTILIHWSSRTAPRLKKIGTAGSLQTMPIFFQGVKSLSEPPFSGVSFCMPKNSFIFWARFFCRIS